MPQPKIEIRMLGGFSVCIDGRPALQGMAQSRKLQQVLQYLLLNRARAVLTPNWPRSSGETPPTPKPRCAP